MYDTSKDLLDAYRASPAVYRFLLKDITHEVARAARGGDENWSIVEVLCHLRDVEERALERVRAMRDEDDPFLPAYDQDVWAQERNYAEADLHEALEAFLAFRSAHVRDLEALSPEQWKRTGRHEEQGTITISDHILHLVAHDTVHAAQIAEQLRVR